MSIRLAPLALLLPLALTLQAEAHVSSYGDTKTLALGDYNVILTPSASPVFTLSLLEIGVQVYTKEYAVSDAPVQLTINGSDGKMRTLPQQAGDGGTRTASTYFQDPGNYTLEATVTDANGTHTGTTWLDVYPRLGFRIVPLNADQDFVAGSSATVPVLVVYDEPPKLEVTDLEGTLELWTPDHSRILRSDDVTFTRDAEAVWGADYDFPEIGMYHMRFESQSGNFTREDVPLLHTYAVEAPAGSETPFPVALLLLAALAAAILLQKRKEQ